MPNTADRWIAEDRRQPARNGTDRRAVPRHSPDGVLNEIFGGLRIRKEDALMSEQKRTQGYWMEDEDVPPIE